MRSGNTSQFSREMRNRFQDILSCSSEVEIKAPTKVQCFRIYLLKQQQQQQADDPKKTQFDGAILQLIENIKLKNLCTFDVEIAYYKGLKYFIDQVTPNPDGAVIVTLSVAFGGEDKADESLQKRRKEINIRKVYKLVPTATITKNLLEILNKSFSGSGLDATDVCMEIVVSHPSLLFSSEDSTYCEWESSCPELPRRTTFRLPPPQNWRNEEPPSASIVSQGSDHKLAISLKNVYAENIPAHAKEESFAITAICVLNNANKDNFETHVKLKSKNESESKQETISQIVVHGPLVLVVWESKTGLLKFLCLYDLLSQQIQGLMRFPKLQNDSKYKISHITATKVENAENTWRVIVGMDVNEPTGINVSGYIGKFEIDTIKFQDASDISFIAEKLHENKLAWVHLSRDNNLFIGSYDKKFSVMPLLLDQGLKPQKQCPMDEIKIPTHIDIILSVVPLEGTNKLFSASWDTTIRYWEKNENDWISYQFPYEHKKKVGCLAFCKVVLSNTNGNCRCTSPTNCCFSSPSASKDKSLCKKNESKEDMVTLILVSGSLDSTLIVWDVSKPKMPVVAKRLKGHTDEVTVVKILPQRQPVIISGSRDKTIRFWDLYTGECCRLLETTFPVLTLDLCSIFNATKYNPDQICGTCKGKKLDYDHEVPSKLSKMGDIVVAWSDKEMMCWNFLSNDRQFMQYANDLVISLAMNPFNQATSNIPVYVGTSGSTIITTVKGIRLNSIDIVKGSNDKVRVNALLWVSSQSKGNFLIAGLANGYVSVISQTNEEKLKEKFYFHTGMQNVFCLAWYDPEKCEKMTVTNLTPTANIPLLFVGGIGDSQARTLQIYDMAQLLGVPASSTPAGSTPVTLTKGINLSFDKIKDIPVRDVTVHYLEDGRAVFLTGDYARNTDMWLIQSDPEFPKLRHFRGLHQSQFIMSVKMFNPLREWIKAQGKQENLKKIEWKIYETKDDQSIVCHKYSLAECDLVITGGYDGKIGFWPSVNIPAANEIQTTVTAADEATTEANPMVETKKPADTQSVEVTNHFKFVEHDNGESITAMSVFFPNQAGTMHNPLLLTGSIDNFIYIWDIYELKRLRVLTGHSERINALVTYFRNNTQPILVSGGDDKCITFWEDGLQHHKYLPPKHAILQSFYNDILAHNDNWQQMKVLKTQYPNIFWEFPHLFYLALIERQESFFVEFIDDLKKVITRIPKYPRGNNCKSRWMHHQPEGEVDILEYAMHCNTLLALRAILLAWSYILDEHIEDSINQKVLYANRLFHEKNLLELAAHFPVEYSEFVTSLRLVRAHTSAGSVGNNLRRVIPHGNRFLILGSSSFAWENSSFREEVREELLYTWHFWLLPVRFIYSKLRWFKVNVINGEEENKQAVTPFMLPIRHFSDIKHLYCAVRTCDALKSVDIFESDVLMAAVHHNWNTRGWRIYLINLGQYTLTIFMFVTPIYSYQAAISTKNPRPEALRYCQMSLAAFMFFMLLFGLNELCQVIGKYVKLYNFTFENWTWSRIFHILLNHFVCDVWNIIDYCVVITGVMGAYGKFIELNACSTDPSYYVHTFNVTQSNNLSPQEITRYYCDVPGRSESITNCLLAATAVLLWFKVLYFLRPFKAAGQFVVMVMLILDDIKYFVFVLSCVLVGFAQGFWLILNGAYPATAFTDVKDSYFTTFMFMFGQIDQDQIENSRSSDFAKGFLVIFMITMMILLFNLLIALMGDSFDRTKEKIETHYRKELASFLVDQTAPISFATLLQAFGCFKLPEDEFIHVVKYTSDVKKSGKVFGSYSAADQSDEGHDAKNKVSSLLRSLEAVKESILTNDHTDLFKKDRDDSDHQNEIIDRFAPRQTIRKSWCSSCSLSGQLFKLCCCKSKNDPVLQDGIKKADNQTDISDVKLDVSNNNQSESGLRKEAIRGQCSIETPTSPSLLNNSFQEGSASRFNDMIVGTAATSAEIVVDMGQIFQEGPLKSSSMENPIKDANTISSDSAPTDPSVVLLSASNDSR